MKPQPHPVPWFSQSHLCFSGNTEPGEQRLCTCVCLYRGQTDGVPLHSSDVYTQDKELPTSPVTVCRHHPSVDAHSAMFRCFPSPVQASLPLLQVGGFFPRSPCPSSVTPRLGQLRAGLARSWCELPRGSSALWYLWISPTVMCVFPCHNKPHASVRCWRRLHPKLSHRNKTSGAQVLSPNVLLSPEQRWAEEEKVEV